ncbi:MAG: YhdH/YhfP family quinone oxidoreductase [Xanthomonadales bacterium]|nr:YhdH/YhfP family quinone oxidoreductase [Xanthomonadales bacterium]MDH4019666.1 YhdH/YhfP family quinone oxidoreductase [Xanthomonadales bacterium]
MTNVPQKFKAFRIHNDAEGYRSGIESIGIDDLSEGDVVIRGEWSSINYKDALAATGKGKILKKYPLIGGIDVAGEVVSSECEQFSPGDKVLVTGCDLSEKRDGGYSQYLRLDSNSVIPLPSGLTTREAMGIGTAGFTAAISLYRMEALGQTPQAGPIVVTGASGGVGSFAIDILTRAGYEVHAITGKVDQFDYLEELGARQCISRHDLHWGQKPLESIRWAGCIDSVGGDMLSGISRVIDLWGNIAVCGMAGGIGLNATNLPLILRGVSLIGISSVNTPYNIRKILWDRLANEWRPRFLETIVNNEVSLDNLGEAFGLLMKGNALGRTVVKLS